MARSYYSKLAISLCPNLIGMSRIRFKSPTLCSKTRLARIDTDRVDESEGKGCCDHVKTSQKESIARRKVMVVVDWSPEAKTALHWALTHAVQPDDTVVLLHVVKPSSIVGEKSENVEENHLLHVMKSICQTKRPEVHVDLSTVEEREERGPAIVKEAKKREISLLVIGHRRRSVTLRLLMIWAAGGKPTAADTVDYCVQNATCMAVAVRRKSRKGSGYLITTRRLKDFWLLA